MATTARAGRTERGAGRSGAAHDVEFAANPLRILDPALGAAAERVVAAALAEGPPSELGRIAVRFGVVPPDDGAALRFVCKVECTGAHGQPPWRWWSSLASEPSRLGRDLARCLERRRRRLERTAHELELEEEGAWKSATRV